MLRIPVKMLVPHTTVARLHPAPDPSFVLLKNPRGDGESSDRLLPP